MDALKTQAWVGSSEPTSKRLEPMLAEGRSIFKPKGGLWTSTYHEDFGSDWCQWCLSEEFRIDRHKPLVRLWTLEPRDDARIFVVNTYADLEELVEEYRTDARGFRDYPDWLKVSRDFDAIHLTKSGQLATHLTYPYSLYAWDCESTVWFRWRFVQVNDVGVVRISARDPWWEDYTAEAVSV